MYPLLLQIYDSNLTTTHNLTKNFITQRLETSDGRVAPTIQFYAQDYSKYIQYTRVERFKDI